MEKKVDVKPRKLVASKRKTEEKDVEEPKKRKIQKSAKSSTTSKKVKDEVLVIDELDPESSFKENDWKDFELLSELQGTDLFIAKNVAKMFNEGCTIPFIARYRKDCTGNMSPEVLRELKQCYDQINVIKAKSQSVLKILQTNGNLTPLLEKSVLSAKTLDEIEHIYAPYKSTSKKTLFERAKKLGLEEPSLKLLTTYSAVNLNLLIDPTNEDMNTYEKIENGIIHIIAHVVATDLRVLTYLRQMRTKQNFAIEVKKTLKRNKTQKNETKDNVKEEKYENYYDFKSNSRFIKSHQIMAINRGENQNVLSVKIIVPDYIYNNFSKFCWDIWSEYIRIYDTKRQIFDKALQDCYKRLVQPLIVREVRSELKTKAEKASLDVFCNNLKQLLLTAPVKGYPIVGIDPGFTNGCKTAVIGTNGALLEATILYPLRQQNGKDAKTLKDLLQKHRCSLIALGNGTACRETESWLSDLISSEFFQPLNVEYTIVNENGASIYSCSKEAKKEFNDVDPNIISAISLARRIQDPLAEYVKVEPKHIGVGMYQHDLPKGQLEDALNEVVSECVSFVGVDINTCSECLLRRVAGLSEKRAKLIIGFRDKNGGFISRQQLTDIKGIGAKTFEQCAGFLKVVPVCATEEDAFYRNPKANRLDSTIIHPESYTLVKNILKKEGLEIERIGKAEFIAKIKMIAEKFEYDKYCQMFDTSEQTLKLILEGLAKTLNYDMRDDSMKIPLFKKGLTNITDLKSGVTLTGNVTNNTHFGSFIDVGVGVKGLIHISKTKGQTLEIGDMVEVKVINIDVAKRRIGLELIRIM